MTCKLCSSPSSRIFRKKILNKYDVEYYQCTSCGFIQTEEPYWLQEAYAESINLEDTGIIDRNMLFAKRAAMVLYFFFDKKGVYLDYGGGYGLFVRLMRDYGFDFYWSDPFTRNLFARGFEFNEKEYRRFELVTTFECFEHFSDPVPEIERMLQLSDSILFSTEIFSGKAPSSDEWSFYSFSHGQHVSLYSLESLQYLARKYQVHLCTNGKSFHLLSKKRVNNTAFNFLLKTSLLGVPQFLKISLGSKLHSDSQMLQQIRMR